MMRVMLNLDSALQKPNVDKENTQLPDQTIIIREYDETLCPELEFRAFVTEGKRLTAFTQYFKTCHVPYILQHKATIEQKIKAVIEQVLYPKFQKLYKEKAAISPTINVEEQLSKLKYVVDFALDYTVHENTNECLHGVKIVEFNPFGTSTSAGLFDWNVKEDEQILRGNAPFQFRCIEKPFTSRAEIRGKLSKDVQALLNDMRPLPAEQHQEHKQQHQQEQQQPQGSSGDKKNCIIS